MNVAVVTQALEGIERAFRSILDQSSLRVLEDAKAEAEASFARYRKGKDTKWGYTVDRSAPLTFVPSTIRDLDLNVDVYCQVFWKEDSVPVEQDVKIRVWTKHEETMFRDQWDAEEVRDQLDGLRWRYGFRGRLISRWHFDRTSASDEASTREFHPKYHLQYGGTDEPHELSWHPEKVNMPRLPYPPMDLALACQLVAANFFWSDYVGVRDSTEWLSRVKGIEREMLLTYYTRCARAVDQGGITLLDTL